MGVLFIRKNLNESVTVEIIHSDLSRLLESFTAAGIILYQVKLVDEMTAILNVERKFWFRLQQISKKQSAQLKVIRNSGFLWRFKRLLNRPVLIAAIAAIVLLSAVLPRRILIITVEGNVNLSGREIMEAAESAGIGIGTLRHEVRSEKIKNHLLQVLPQLQWVGINTHGCRAVITVKERTDIENAENTLKYGAIVAARDGVVHSVHAAKGTVLCKVGQAVKAGEVLVSGYTDCGLTIRATGAEGEVYAQTLRNLETVVPSASVEKGSLIGKNKKYSLIIGKKRIKFYKDSGICDASCDKMYTEYCMSLPGGFQMPIAIAVETLLKYETETVSASRLQEPEALQRTGEAYLLQNMVAGTILSADVSLVESGKDVRVIGKYRCLEMIGRLQQEEITGYYGKNN